MSNKNHLNFSIFEFATQFKLLIGFIIAHDYDINRRSISAIVVVPALSDNFHVISAFIPTTSGIFRQLSCLFPLFYRSVIPVADLARICLYITRPLVFASVSVNAEQDQKLQKTHFLCFNSIPQWRTLGIFINNLPLSIKISSNTPDLCLPVAIHLIRLVLILNRGNQMIRHSLLERINLKHMYI
jgi:hypothetical protein